LKLPAELAPESRNRRESLQSFRGTNAVSKRPFLCMGKFAAPGRLVSANDGPVDTRVCPGPINPGGLETIHAVAVSGNSLQIPCSRIKIPCSACKNSLLGRRREFCPKPLNLCAEFASESLAGAEIGKNSLQIPLGCTPVVRHEKWEQLGRHSRFDGGGRGCRMAPPAKRKRALLGSNPPRNSRPETHGDAAGAGEHARRRRLVMARGAAHHLASP